MSSSLREGPAVRGACPEQSEGITTAGGFAPGPKWTENEPNRPNLSLRAPVFGARQSRSAGPKVCDWRASSVLRDGPKWTEYRGLVHLNSPNN